MVALVLLGILVGGALAWAAWMDVRASRSGKRWVPIRSDHRFGRTRFHLVDRAVYDAERRRLHLDAALAERASRAAGPARGGYLVQRPGRSRRS